MKGCLFIGTTGDHAGQTLFTWALIQRLTETGLRVSLFKPFATHPLEKEGKRTDSDALFFKMALDLKAPLDSICPFVTTEGSLRDLTPDQIIDQIVLMVKQISSDVDVLVIMGFKDVFFDDVSHPVSDTSLVKALDAHLLLLTRYQEASTAIYSILSVCSLMRDRVRGVVLNRVPPEKLELVKEQFVPFLTQKGVPISACLPEDPTLACRSLREVVDVVEGELLVGEESSELAVAGMTVGSADLSGGLAIFKRVYNKLVLTGPQPCEQGPDGGPGPRPVVGILLTSGRRPPAMLVEAAKNAGIALGLTNQDTFAALDRLQRSVPSLSPGDHGKLRRFTELLDREDALNRLIVSLGLGSLRVP